MYTLVQLFWILFVFFLVFAYFILRARLRREFTPSWARLLLSHLGFVGVVCGAVGFFMRVDPVLAFVFSFVPATLVLPGVVPPPGPPSRE